MLYVSRYIGRNKLGVVDTDDGVEDEFPVNVISDIEMQYGFSIAGSENRNLSYAPYQLPSETHPLQAKLLMAYGIGTVIYKGKLSAFFWSQKADNGVVNIRVSDLVTGFHDFVFRDNLYGSDTQVRFIFDDKVEPVGPFSLIPLIGRQVVDNVNSIPVSFDLREVTNLELVSSVYDSLRKNVTDLQCCSIYEMNKAIIDNANRKFKMFNSRFPLPF